LKRYRCISKGVVQGVWYRRAVQKMAQAAGFKGTVRNLPDRTVESVVDVADEAALESFIQLLRKGSPMSIVTQVACEEIATDAPFQTFEVIQ